MSFLFPFGRHVVIQGNVSNLSGISVFYSGFLGTVRIVCSSVASGRALAFDRHDKLLSMLVKNKLKLSLSPTSSFSNKSCFCYHRMKTW